jgi:hypothetical protein
MEYLGPSSPFRWSLVSSLLENPHSLSDYVARFCLGPRAAQEARCSVRFGTDFVVKSNREPDINAKIFLDYIRTVFLFFPNCTELRTLDEFAEELESDWWTIARVMSLMMCSISSPRYECMW